ncbi:hypothetical protein M9Y34_10120 [Acinetobacter baumannii]|nr:hypothetical protein [Acinetobacter baumannii]
MNIDSLPIDFAIDEIKKGLNIPYDERTLADDVKSGSLELCFFLDSTLFELEFHTETTAIEETFVKLHHVTYHKHDVLIDNKFSNCFNIINNNTKGNIFTVIHKGKTCLLSFYDFFSQKDIYGTSTISQPIYEYKELIHPLSLNRDQLRVTRSSLDKFLYTNTTHKVSTDEGEIAEMNSDKALAIMALMLSEKSAGYKIGNRPNSAKIADEIYDIATKHFSVSQLNGLNSFHKRISKALNTLNSH